MDVSFLKALYDVPGPFASVYIDMRRDTEDAPKAIEVRWHAARKELTDHGAPRPTVDAIGRLIEDENELRESGTLVAFAAGTEIVHHELLPGAPVAECARYAPLPYVQPLLAQRGEKVSHVVAVVDRVGGTVTCVPQDGVRRTVEVASAEDVSVHKPKGGDPMREARNQRAAEDAWRANAKKIGRVVSDVAENCGAEVVVLAGDVRARAAVLEELTEPVLSRTIDSGPAGPALDAQVARALELKRDEHLTGVIGRFGEQLARKRAVDGLANVTRAMQKAQVACLLLAGGPVDEARLWAGPRTTDLATTEAELRDLGVAEPVEDEAISVLIRSLVGTDGELAQLPPDGQRINDGAGALLRFAD